MERKFIFKKMSQWFKILTKGNNDIVDLTEKVSEIVRETKIKEGMCLVSLPGSTCGLTTIEYEPELLKDFKEFLEKIIPSDKEYHHDNVWGERNGFSHLRSALIKPFLTIPIEDGRLVLGQWQSLVLLDFDNRPREREVVVKIIGK